MKNKIAIIVPYFGMFPVWFDLYLYSCSKNPQVDFLFFTDCVLPENKYDNTIFFNIDFESYCKRVSDCLSIDFRPTNPYKLCDLKPFYGVIHKQELTGYDFWGFGDCDLVYGDLSIILNEKNLQRYDFITTHGYCVAGHFTVMRNRSKYTLKCFDIPDWREKLSLTEHCNLDENAYSFVVLPAFKHIHRLCRYIIRPLKLCSDDQFYKIINPIFCNPLTKKLIKEYHTTPAPVDGETWVYDLKTGVVKELKNNRDLPYLHFLFFKKTPYLSRESYWKPGFYKLSLGLLSGSTHSEKVKISVEGIKVE